MLNRVEASGDPKQIRSTARSLSESIEVRAMRFLKRTFESWPYLFIVFSVTGLLYLALSASR